MSVYSDLDEDQLNEAIASLRTQIRTASTAGNAGVKSIAGEGRRVEFFGSGGGTSLSELRRLLREAEDALRLLQGGGGSAIGVCM